MKLKIFILATATAIGLGACGPTGNRGADANIAMVGDHEVKWSRLPAFQSRVPEGLTPLVFTFTSRAPASQNGVTEEDWIREAAKAGWPPQDYKNVLYGGNAYKRADGSLGICTQITIRKGLCKVPPRLPLAKRVEIAQNLLAAQGGCSWVGFDPAYHQAAAFELGAGDAMLHVPAKC